MNGAGAQFFSIIVADPDPRQRVRTLGDQALSEALEEIEALPLPNDFHRAVYGMLISEQLIRWRAMAGVEVKSEDGSQKSE